MTRAAGCAPARSPTYALVHEYAGPGGLIVHVDCYRLARPDDAADLDFPDLLGRARLLLIEWPEGEDAPTKYWLSTLPAGTPIATLVDTAKLRWRIERDFQDLKQEIGLDHY